MSIGSIVVAVLVFSVIIIFHEFGHFIVAKANHVDVIEFSLGMGPRIISWASDGTMHTVLFFKSTAFFEEHTEFDRHTIYSWKILPFGGSCMMLGEEEDVDDEHSFSRSCPFLCPPLGPMMSSSYCAGMSSNLCCRLRWEIAPAFSSVFNSSHLDASLLESKVSPWTVTL